MDELLLTMLKNFVEDGCWHSDRELITEDCATLDCHECFVAKAKPLIEKAERERMRNWLSQWQGVWRMEQIQLYFAQDIEKQSLKEGK